MRSKKTEDGIRNSDDEIMAAKTLLLDDGGLLWYSPNDLGKREPEATKADFDWVEADALVN